MANFYQSTEAASFEPVRSANGTEVIAIRGNFAVPAGLALNDVIEMVPIPADYDCLDVILDAQDVDTGTTLTLNVGVMSGTYRTVDASRTCGADFLAASNVAQAGGVARANVTGFSRLAPSDSDRSIGLKVAAAATGVTAGAIITLTAYFRAMIRGV
jgi:hypothetical protein